MVITRYAVSGVASSVTRGIKSPHHRISIYVSYRAYGQVLGKYQAHHLFPRLPHQLLKLLLKLVEGGGL